MAKGKKTGGRDFRPGNPHHRPRLPEDIKQARALTRMEFERVANRFLSLPEKELKRVKDEEATSALERIVIEILLTAIRNGDQVRLDFLLARLIGKVPDKIQVTDEERELQEMSDQELAALGKKAIVLLEGKK